MAHALPAVANHLASLAPFPADSQDERFCGSFVSHVRSLARFASSQLDSGAIPIVQLAEVLPVASSLQAFGRQCFGSDSWGGLGEPLRPEVKRVLLKRFEDAAKAIVMTLHEVEDPLDERGPYLLWEISNHHMHAKPLKADLKWLPSANQFFAYNYEFPGHAVTVVVPHGLRMELHRAYKVDNSLPLKSSTLEWEYSWRLV
jgi:hypothetical protein